LKPILLYCARWLHRRVYPHWLYSVAWRESGPMAVVLCSSCGKEHRRMSGKCFPDEERRATPHADSVDGPCLCPYCEYVRRDPQKTVELQTFAPSPMTGKPVRKGA
jgi:hypothetical protein